MAKHKGIAGGNLFIRGILKTLFGGKSRDIEALGKGYQDERRIGRELKNLPEGWRVWHDLNLGSENIDHLVASAKGVFIIEAKNYQGSVLALNAGLYTHGNKRPNAKVTAQVWRQV